MAEKPKGINKLVRKRRKSDHCLNCGAQYDERNNYCPNCGQENNHNQASFATLVIDFLNNYFSLDSKFSLSLVPFFLKPGYLTIRFIEGKRASFVNPIRLYLIVSLVFFFIFNMISKDVVQQSIDAVENVTESIPDSSKQVIDQVLSDIGDLEEDTVINISGMNADSTESNYQVSFQPLDSTNSFLTEENINTYMKLRDNYDYSVDEVMDSLNTASLSGFQFNLTKQIIRLDRAEGQVVISQLLKNLPIMMLFTLPIFALILKLFYIRRNQYYITHLVHALHLHSFSYVIFGLVFAAAYYWLPSGWVANLAVIIGDIMVGTYCYVSFLRVYKQGWFKTLVKFNLVGFLYFWLLLFAVFIEMVFSVYTY